MKAIIAVAACLTFTTTILQPLMMSGHTDVPLPGFVSALTAMNLN